MLHTYLLVRKNRYLKVQVDIFKNQIKELKNTSKNFRRAIKIPDFAGLKDYLEDNKLKTIIN